MMIGRTLPSVALCLVLAWAASASPARANPADDPASGGPQDPHAAANALKNSGLDRYRAGDYRGAADAFEASFALDPQADVLYAWAQAERFAGRCAAAVALYDRFLATEPGESDVRAARYAREQCAGTNNSGDTPKTPSTATTASSTAAGDNAVRQRALEPTIVGTSDRQIPWYLDPWAGALTAAGAVLVVGGVSALSHSTSVRNDARRETRYDRFDTMVDDARRWNTIGNWTTAAGIGVLCAATVRYVWVATSDHQQVAATPSVEISEHSTTIGLSARF